MTDIFQEVEEDVRRERYAALWKKYGHYVVSGAIVFVLGIAGYKGWEAYDRNQRQNASNRFFAAVDLAQNGEPAEAANAFGAFVGNAPEGYEQMAQFRLAGMLAEQGRTEEAATLLQRLSGLSDSDLANTARVQLAWLRADTATSEEMQSLVAPMNTETSAWRFAAREVIAYTQLHGGQASAAREAYQSIMSAPDAPEGIRNRASAIVQYLNANSNSLPVTSGQESMTP